MKARAAVLPLLSFATGVLAVVWWPASTAGNGGVLSLNQEGRPGMLPPAVPGSAAGAKGNSATGAKPASGAADDLFLTGLDKPPTMEDVLAAAGLERNLRMGVWLQTASSAQMAEMLDRCRDAEIYDTFLTDAVWLRWTEVDREAAVQRRPSHEVWWALAKIDPAAAVEAARKEGPGALKEVVRSIGQSDPAAALTLMAESPEADSRKVWEGVLFGMRAGNPAAAAALALEKGVDLKDTVEAWMERDPDAALAWAKGQEDPVKRRRVMELALEQLTMVDPDAALDEARQLPAGFTRSRLMAKALARTDTEVAFHTIKTMMPNPIDRALAYAEMVPEISGSLPEDSLTALRRSLSEENALRAEASWTFRSADGGTTSKGSIHDNSANITALEDMMARQPEATAEILATLPDPTTAPVERAIGQWANQDPAAVSGWIERQPAGLFKDQAVSGLTDWLLHQSPEPDPEAAAAWSLAASPDYQKGLLLNSFQAWHREDPAAARAAADRLPMTAEQRDAVLQNLNALDQQAK